MYFSYKIKESEGAGRTKELMDVGPGHVPHMEQIRNSMKLFVGKPGRNRTLEGLGLDVRIILE
jgi:hypothetical protein